MRHRRLLAVLLLISAGCASNAPPKQSEQARITPPLSPGFQNTNQRESLTLEQTGSTPLMPGPTTRSGQPPIESVRLFAQARIAMLDNDRNAAISFLQKAVALDPASFELHVELADQYDSANNPLALLEYQKAARIEPNHLDLLIDIARHQISDDKPEDAIRELRLARLTDEYLADDPSSAEADFLLAQALQDADYDRAAIEVYQNLLNRLQTQSRIVARNAQGDALLRHPAVLAVHIAALYEKHRQYDEALAVLRSAAKQVPNEFALNAQIVRDISAQGRRHDAISAATDLVTQFHGDDASVALLRDICGDPGQTQSILQSIIQKHSNASLYGALADLQAANGHPADAAQTLSTALARWPNELRLIRRRVNQLRTLGDFPLAAKLIAEQLARRPEDDLELETIFDRLTRPSAHGRLRTADMRAVQVSPNAIGAKLLLVSHCAAVDRGDADQRKVLDEALNASPPCLPAWRERLLLLFNENRPPNEIAAAATSLISRAEKVFPPGEVDQLRGRLALSAQQGKDAAEVLARAIRAGGRSSELFLDFASSLEMIKDERGAIAVLRRLVADHPLCAQAHEALIEAYVSRGDSEAANGARRAWIAVDPDSVAAHRSLVMEAVAEQRKEEAHEILIDLFNRDSSNSETLAAIIASDADSPVWIPKMRERFANQPWNYSLGEALIELLRAHNDVRGALSVADRMRAGFANDADLLYKVSGLYSRLNDATRGESVLEQILKLDPDFAGPNNDLGYTWVSEGRKLQEAESLIRKAVKLEPDNPAFLDSLGWVLYKRGQFADAVAALTKSVGISSEPDPLVLDHLGDAQWRDGQRDQAKGTWQQAADRIAKMNNDVGGDDLTSLRASLEKKSQSASRGQDVQVAPLGAETK